MKWNACVDHSDSPARINLVVKVFLCFLIILSPTHNHASLEMSDEPEGLPVRDEVATIVTMLHVTCYVKGSPDLVIVSSQEKQILHYASTGMEDYVRFLV